MKKIIKRLKLRNQQFKSHPITRDNRIKAMSRYIIFNSINQFKTELKYNWIDNLKFIASKGDAGIVGNIYYGIYEFNESVFILHYLREKDVFLDIGANVGHYSLLASGIKNCKSIAIEPVPDTFKKLTQQIELNKLQHKIETFNIGVGDTSSNLFFSTDKSTMNRIVDNKYKNSVKIQVKTIDNICLDQDINIIKIDVEGYEKFVLNGSTNTIKNEKLKAIIIEINDSNKFYGVENEEILEILISNNFYPYKYNPMKRELIKLDTYNKEQFNTIFIRDLDFVINRVNGSSKINIWNKLV